MQTLPESSLLITHEVIRAYAELTQDFNPLHLDAEFAAGTAMGGVIAHGTLSINLVWQSITAALGDRALEQAELDIRFVKPVRAGERLVASGTRDDADPNRFAVRVLGPDGTERLVGEVLLSGSAARD
jgi:acyl dehydratase